MNKWVVMLFFGVVLVALSWVAGIVVMSLTGHSTDISTLNGVMTLFMGTLIAGMQWLVHNTAQTGVQQNNAIMANVDAVKQVVKEAASPGDGK